MAYEVYMTKGNNCNRKYLGKAETINEAADMLYDEADDEGVNLSHDGQSDIIEALKTRGYYGFGYSSLFGEVEEC